MTSNDGIAQLNFGDLLDVAGTLEPSADEAEALPRLRTLAFEALAQGMSDERMTSLMHLLDWHDGFSSFAIAGKPRFGFESTADAVRTAIWDFGGHDWLVGSNRGCFVALIALEGALNPHVLCKAVDKAFDATAPLCLTPPRADVKGASQNISAAINTVQVASAIEPLPRPLYAQEALPERALMGDTDARDELYTDVFAALKSQGEDGSTLQTVSTFLNSGGSLELTAHELNIHPNTVRYRLRQVSDLTGLTPGEPRDAFTIQIALVLGRLSGRD